MNRQTGLIRGTAVAGALVAAAVLAYAGSQIGAASRPQPVAFAAGTPTAHASAQAVASTAPSGAQPAVVAAFTCSPAGGGSGAGNLSAVRVAHHAGYDRIVFEFSGRLPAYRLTPQATSRFVRDASGRPVTLRGSAGLRVVFQDASGFPTYTGSADLTPSLPVVREVARLGDFERVLSWGVGLSSAACTRVAELSSPPRLVIDVQTPEAAG